jgi:hypothetical protein
MILNILEIVRNTIPKDFTPRKVVRTVIKAQKVCERSTIPNQQKETGGGPKGVPQNYQEESPENEFFTPTFANEDNPDFGSSREKAQGEVKEASLEEALKPSQQIVCLYLGILIGFFLPTIFYDIANNIASGPIFFLSRRLTVFY